MACSSRIYKAPSITGGMSEPNVALDRCGCTQAKEFGEAEVWMNERLMRAAPRCFAQFITAFDDGEARVQSTRGPAGQVRCFFQ